DDAEYSRANTRLADLSTTLEGNSKIATKPGANKGRTTGGLCCFPCAIRVASGQQPRCTTLAEQRSASRSDPRRRPVDSGGSTFAAAAIRTGIALLCARRSSAGV